MTAYSEKLNDPRWQKKRLEILERDKWACSVCGDKEKTLHVHHKIYNSNGNPWEVANNDLITLCGKCYEEETKRTKSKLLIDSVIKEYYDSGESINKIANILLNICESDDPKFILSSLETISYQKMAILSGRIMANILNRLDKLENNE